MGELATGLGRRLRFGMVGGGPGAFIGAIHRRAASLDGEAELVAGSFSADPARSAKTGRDLYLPSERIYGSYEEMAEREAHLPPDRRLDFVVIVVPNHLHHPVARTFLERGFPVVCDKPLATTIADAEDLATLVQKTGLLFAVTYNYSGYSLVKQARDLVVRGELGTGGGIRRGVPQRAANGVENGECQGRDDVFLAVVEHSKQFAEDELLW